MSFFVADAICGVPARNGLDVSRVTALQLPNVNVVVPLRFASRRLLRPMRTMHALRLPNANV